jgi:hypothetical protein
MGVHRTNAGTAINVNQRKVNIMRTAITSILGALAMVLMVGCESTIVEQGPPGPRGLDGRDGNANVFSLNFDFTMADAIINGKVASVQFDVPGITPSVVDEGAVLVFFREQGTWTALPYTFGFDNPDLQAVDFLVTFGYGYDDGFLEVFYEASAEGVSLEDMPDREMKAVVIDGFPMSKAGIDLTDYEAVKAFLHLAD